MFVICNLTSLFQVPKQELRRSLFHLFSQYGSLLDVVALKTTRMRGQAWIVFEDIVNATNALRQLKGFPFYDKPMVCRVC